MIGHALQNLQNVKLTSTVPVSPVRKDARYNLYVFKIDA